MNLRKIIKEIIEEFLDEKYPVDFSFNELKDIRSYAGKLKYAQKFLKKLASGSARVVYKVDDVKVLKIAKNKKGLAQNQVEAQGYLQKFDIVAKIFDTDDDDYWIEMEYAKKITPSVFRNLTGVDLKELNSFLLLTRMEEKFPQHGYRVGANRREKMESIEFVNQLMKFIKENNMETGDFGRISSWGKVIRNGYEQIVLVDYGLTNSVYEDYYMVS